jgi:hypothetical protein
MEVRLLFAAGGSNQLACQPTITSTSAWGPFSFAFTL